MVDPHTGTPEPSLQIDEPRLPKTRVQISEARAEIRKLEEVLRVGQRRGFSAVQRRGQPSLVIGWQDQASTHSRRDITVA